MYFNDPQKPNPTRGIIIADTSALVFMAFPLSGKFIANENTTQNSEQFNLCEILLFLSLHGYEVIIPEMVALEMSIGRNGVSSNDFFTSDGNDLPYFLRLQMFLKKIPGFSGAIYIAPPPAQDNSSPAIYARSMWKIFSSNDPDSAKMSMLKGIARLYPTHRKKDYGDVAACQLFRFMKKPAVPVFYLSVDQGSRTQMAAVRQDVMINWLSVGPLYEGMRKEGLLGHINIADIPFVEVFDHIQKLYREENPSNRPTRLKVLSDEKFNTSLAGLKSELQIEQEQPIRNTANDDRKTKFDQKWGAFMQSANRPR